MIKILSKKRYNELLRNSTSTGSSFDKCDLKINTERTETVTSVKYLRKEYVSLPHSDEIIKKDVINSIVEYLYKNNIVKFSIEKEVYDDPYNIKCTGILKVVIDND